MSEDARKSDGGEHRSVRLIRIDRTMGAHLDASKDEFEETYQATVGEQESTARNVVAQTLALIDRAPRAPRWGGYLAADKETGRVIGTCGCKHGWYPSHSNSLAPTTAERQKRKTLGTTEIPP